MEIQVKGWSARGLVAGESVIFAQIFVVGRERIENLRRAISRRSVRTAPSWIAARKRSR